MKCEKMRRFVALLKHFVGYIQDEKTLIESNSYILVSKVIENNILLKEINIILDEKVAMNNDQQPKT
jgi:hypothetical protein